MPLRESPIDFLPSGFCALRAGGGAKELECIGASLDLSVGRVLLSVWVLDFGCETWLPSFTPCAIIRVLHDVVEVQVWPVVKKEALGIRLPIKPLRALVAGLFPAEPLPLCDALEAAHGAPGPGCDDPAEETLLIDIEVGAQLDEAQVQLSDSDEEARAPEQDEEALGVDAVPAPRRSVFDFVTHGRRPPGVPQPHPEPRPPRGAPEDASGPRLAPAEERAAPVCVARRDYRVDWPKYLHSDAADGRGKNFLCVPTTVHKPIVTSVLCAMSIVGRCALSRSLAGMQGHWGCFGGGLARGRASQRRNMHNSNHMLLLIVRNLCWPGQLLRPCQR